MDEVLLFGLFNLFFSIYINQSFFAGSADLQGTLHSSHFFFFIAKREISDQAEAPARTIVCVCSIAMAAVSHLMAVGKVGLDSARNASALGEPMMMSLIGAVFAGVFICGDFENETIHDAISCGSGRGAVIVSKAISYFIVIAFMMVPYFVVTVIGVYTDFEYTLYMGSSFLGILSNVSGIDVTTQIIFKILAITLMIMLVYASQMSICVALSFLIRKSAFVIGIGFEIISLIAFIIGLGDVVQILGDIFSYMPFAMGYITMDAAAGDFIKPIDPEGKPLG